MHQIVSCVLKCSCRTKVQSKFRTTVVGQRTQHFVIHVDRKVQLRLNERHCMIILLSL